MEQEFTDTTEQPTTNKEYIFEGDSLYLLVDGEKKGRLDFSIGMTNEGVIQAKVNILVTTNFLHSGFEATEEVRQRYIKYISSLVLGDQHIRDLGYELLLYFVEFARTKSVQEILIEPDSIEKGKYWKCKIGNRLKDEGIIRRVSGDEEISFRL
ncbi:hypothetical protein KBC86_02615 [Candidatus Gracilibacteria bacterium]|nr:hypothetical protein [Candidatus Gracilibacteria bacterium]